MLYDMIGVFIQPLLGNGIFAGNALRHNEKDNKLIGMLYDDYGPSQIEGILDFSRGIMNFNKVYEVEKGRIIKYKFRKKGNIWEGEFGWGESFKGESICEIFFPSHKPKYDWNNILENSQLSISGTEMWAKNMIKEMEQEGYIEIFEDSETGEKFVKPLPKTK